MAKKYVAGLTGFRASCARKPGAQRDEKIFSSRCPYFQNFIKVLEIFDFNGAGKQAKRRRWRIKQACFEEGSQSADMKYPLIGLSRRCIPSWVIFALRAALRRLRSETRLRA